MKIGLLDGMDLIRIGNWALDRALRVGEGEILNYGAAGEPAGDVSRELRRTANEMMEAALADGDRGIDYARLAAHEAYAEYRDLTRLLKSYSPLEGQGLKGQIAFWINLYNALIMDGVITYQVGDSLRGNLSLFRRAAYAVGGHRFSADDIEHGVLRGNARHPFWPLRQFWEQDQRNAFVIDPPEPRIHFALNCAARSCPPLAFYVDERLNEQLNLAAVNFLNRGGARYEPGTKTLWISEIFDWYEQDFGGEGEVLEFVRDRLEDEGARQAIEDGDVEVRYSPYDWTLAGFPMTEAA